MPAVLLGGCGDSFNPSDGVCCGAGAPATLLKSRIDDDDGDGNPFDEDFPTINDEDDDIADHAWIRDAAGVFHLFFQNEALFAPSHLEHYTSTDLHGLDYAGVALAPRPGTWDADGLWAPYIILVDATYYMFYTGVEGTGPGSKQRIGLATSTDLVTWTRYPGSRCPGAVGDGCVYECRESWTAWDGPPGADNQQCRDPFVIRDPDRGRWVMFVTAKNTNQFGVVSVAHSPDLIDWTGAGFLDATRRLASGTGGQTTGGMAENPFVVLRAGVNYLLFTDWRDPEDSVSVAQPRTIVQYATSSTLDVDTLGSANWIYRGYTPDPGVNAIEVQRVRCGAGADVWVMSQSISNPHSGYVKPVRRVLRMMCMIWGDGPTFDTANLNFSPRTTRAMSPTSVEMDHGPAP